MAESIRITTPFTEEMSRKLKAGDSVLITGTIISARDAAHKVMTEALARGEKLPLDWTNQIVYYLGPTPAKPGDPIGSCGPTTSGRMDAYTPTMLEQGIKGMVGKGSRTKEVVDFPAIVVIDCEGNNFYEIGQKDYRHFDMSQI